MNNKADGRKFDLIGYVESIMPTPKKRQDLKFPSDWYWYLRDMGKRKQTPELVKEAIEHCDGEWSSILKFVSKKLLTRDLCQLAVSKCGSDLRYVPNEYRDYVLCYTAVCNDARGCAISYVPAALLQGERRKNLYEAAVQSNGLALEYIPKNRITKKLAYLAVENTRTDFYTYPINYVPERYMSEELVSLSANRCPQSLRYVPGKYISRDLCYDLISKNAQNIGCLPLEVLDEFLIEMALRLDPSTFRCIPREMMREDQYLTALKQTQDTSSSNISVDACVESLKEKYLPQTKPLQLPLPIESACSVIPQQVTETALIHELASEENLPIYYITDIHVEHQLPLQGKSVYEAIQLIDEKITELINSVHDTSAILLVGGDVADSRELVTLFYRELSKMWTGEIFAILGNHELWEAEGKECSVEKVIKEYQEISDYRIHILENELYVKYKGFDLQKLDETILLHSSVEDLIKVCENSTFILLGGIGFSGRNPIYNAAGGLYRTAITTEEDISRSNRFRAIYNKVLACAGKMPVIVMTHTKMADWADDTYNPNWIYLHGHTHQNALIRNNSATVLADNQVGYTPKKWHLNGFTFNKSNYDPFKNYPDGIHEVEAKQYIEFNWGRGVSMFRFRQPGTIYMIKRDDYYMFTLRSTKSLCILSGGARERLTHSMDYYYENLTRYASVVEAAFTPYHDALKRISDEVKAIGGNGHIHGCIVDIDFWNHLYLDPCDGHITPYFAIDMTNKIKYETVRCLLQDSPSPPTQLDGKLLLENYDKKQIDGALLVLADSQKELNDVAVAPELFLDRTMYKSSRIMRSVQYLFDGNVVRIWRDEILAKPSGIPPVHLQAPKKQLESSE